MEILSTLVGAAIGFLASILTEPVRDYFFGPRLTLEFNPDKQDFVTPTPAMDRGAMMSALYIRVLVTNKRKRIAKQCRAYLVTVDKWNDEYRRFLPTHYCDAMQLAWSACPELQVYGPIDLPKEVHRFVDVISFWEGASSLRLHSEFLPYRYKDLLTQETGKYRYTVLVTGENFKPVSIQLGFSWDGKWDQCHAFKV